MVCDMCIDEYLYVYMDQPTCVQCTKCAYTHAMQLFESKQSQ